MAVGPDESLDNETIFNVWSWVRSLEIGNITIHVDRNNARFARTSQEAYDNMLALYKILSNEKTAVYKAYTSGGTHYCDRIVCATPAAIRDYIRKLESGSSQNPEYALCGTDVHQSTVICGQGGVDINKVKAKSCLMVNIAALMGVIEVVSGYNPFFHTQEYLDLQGYYLYNGGKYYSNDPTNAGVLSQTYSETDRYNSNIAALNGLVWTPYEYRNYWTNGINNYNMGTLAEMKNCRYGLLGLLTPYSASCYAYGRKYNPNNDPSTVRITQGHEVNFIEQVLYDICGFISQDVVWSTTESSLYPYQTFGLANGNRIYSKVNYVNRQGQNANLNNYNRLVFQNQITDAWNHWNGLYTKRESIDIIRDEITPFYDDGYISGLNLDPPWSTRIRSLSDYQRYPWWTTGTKGHPEAAVMGLISSIDTFNYDADFGDIDIHLVPNTIVTSVLDENLEEDPKEEEIEDENKGEEE